MKAIPEEFDVSALVGALADGWGSDAEAADYGPWGRAATTGTSTDSTGPRRFVTVDDLDQKPWLGDTRDSAFVGFGAPSTRLVALRGLGLDFVVAPIRTGRGEALRRPGPRHAIALFPSWQAGGAGSAAIDAATGGLSSRCLATSIEATAAVTSWPRDTSASKSPVVATSRRGFMVLNETWTGGPLSERARQALAANAADVSEMLALADRLAADVAGRRSEWVVTHGEPHAANVMWTGERHVLIDRDRWAGLSRARILWMVVHRDGDEACTHTATTGHTIDWVAMDFYRLAWDLDDLATYSANFDHRIATTKTRRTPTWA